MCYGRPPSATTVDVYRVLSGGLRWIGCHSSQSCAFSEPWEGCGPAVAVRKKSFNDLDAGLPPTWRTYVVTPLGSL